jgi:phage tail tube protein FII
MHHKHNVEIFYDNSDEYFDVLYIDGEVEKGKRLKEINLKDLADESETFRALGPKGL